MAVIKGKNFAKNDSTPKEQSSPGEVGGVARILFDQYDGTPTAADVLSIGVIPKGARILSVTGIGIGGSPSWAKVTVRAYTNSSGTVIAAETSSTLAAGDVLAVESLIKITIGSSPSANAAGFVTYVVD